MAKNQEVLSKMQEQLDYATSRCGNLMEQLNKIKDHVNWQWKKDIWEEDGSLEEGEKEDDKESTESFLTNNDQQIETDDLESKEEGGGDNINIKSKAEKNIPSRNSSLESIKPYELSYSMTKEEEILRNEKEKVKDNSEFKPEYYNVNKEITLNDDDVMYVNDEYSSGDYTDCTEEDAEKIEEDIIEKLTEEKDGNLKKEIQAKKTEIMVNITEDESNVSKHLINHNKTCEANNFEAEEKVKPHPADNGTIQGTNISSVNDTEKDTTLQLIESDGTKINQESNDQQETLSLKADKIENGIIQSKKDKEIKINEKCSISSQNLKKARLDKNMNYNKHESNVTPNSAFMNKKKDSINEVKHNTSNQNKQRTLKYETTVRNKQRKLNDESQVKNKFKLLTANKSKIVNSQLEEQNIKSNKKNNQNTAVKHKVKEGDIKKQGYKLSAKAEEITKETTSQTSTEPKYVNVNNERSPKHSKYTSTQCTENRAESIYHLQKANDKTTKLINNNRSKQGNVENKFKNVAINTQKLLPSQQNNMSNTKEKKVQIPSKNINNKIHKPQNKLEVKKSHEIITKSLFDSIQKTIRKNLNINKNEVNMVQYEEQNLEIKEENKKGSNEYLTSAIDVRNIIYKLENKKIKTKNLNINKSNAIDNIDKKKIQMNINGPKAKVMNKSNTLKREFVINKTVSAAKIINRSAHELISPEKAKEENYLSTFDTCKKKFLCNSPLRSGSEYNLKNIKIPELFTKKRPETGSKNVLSNYLTDSKLKPWEENSSFDKPSINKQTYRNTLQNPVTNNTKESNLTLAQSLGFNAIPFIVGQSTSKSYHIGLNIQQTLSLMKISPSMPALKICSHDKIENDCEKISSFGSISSATYFKPKSCPACTMKPSGCREGDEEEGDDEMRDDPWYVPQKDLWDHHSIANKKWTRCTCLPKNIISFNEVLKQLFHADGLISSNPQTNGTKTSFIDEEEIEKDDNKIAVRPNNAFYFTRLLRNIQRIQDQYITPITKLSLNGFKYKTHQI